MNRITTIVSFLLLTTAACAGEVVVDEPTEAAVSSLTKKEALAEYKQAISCEPGDTTLAKDGCNKCVCTKGVWACTKKLCVQDVEEDVAECKDGQLKKADDGCNSCKCSDGSWACTMKLCLEEQDIDDTAVCKDGAVAPAKDGCNTCKCIDGGWACTKKACSDPKESKAKK